MQGAYDLAAGRICYSMEGIHVPHISDANCDTRVLKLGSYFSLWKNGDPQLQHRPSYAEPPEGFAI